MFPVYYNRRNVPPQGESVTGLLLQSRRNKFKIIPVRVYILFNALGRDGKYIRTNWKAAKTKFVLYSRRIQRGRVNIQLKMILFGPIFGRILLQHNRVRNYSFLYLKFIRNYY